MFEIMKKSMKLHIRRMLMFIVFPMFSLWIFLMYYALIASLLQSFGFDQGSSIYNILLLGGFGALLIGIACYMKHHKKRKMAK